MFPAPIIAIFICAYFLWILTDKGNGKLRKNKKQPG
jgi:hypothetical protein